jgi:tellurite resistance protein
MKAFLDCLPCIARQTLETTRIATSDISLQRAALVKVLGRLAETDGRITPMELGQMGQEVAREVTGCDDPYTQLKEQSNARALELYPRLKEIVEAAEEPLRTATQIAIAGNIIDFGVPHKIDVEGTLERVLGSSFAVDEYDLFAQRLGEAERVFYLADNAGEIVFDRVIICPHFGHFCWLQGTPTWCGAVVPQLGQTQFPPGPMAKPPPRPRPPPPPCPPPRPMPRPVPGPCPVGPVPSPRGITITS